MIAPVKIEEGLINSVVNKIVERFAPQKVILFGSRARGEATPDSDLDLFVVMPSNLRRDNRGMEISKLFPDRLFPLDVLVYTPDELEMSQKRNNPFIKDILREGKVLYGG
jgi:predicted nucleotidyltransferase